jgi:hypothetical protein
VKKFMEASEGNDPERIKQAAKEEGARAKTVTYPSPPPNIVIPPRD